MESRKKVRNLNELFVKKGEGESIFYQRLKELAEEKHKSFNEVERELNYTRNALANYRNYTIPSGLRLIELSDYFGVSPSYLIGQVNEKGGDAIKERIDGLDLIGKEELFDLFKTWILSNVTRYSRVVD